MIILRWGNPLSNTLNPCYIPLDRPMALVCPKWGISSWKLFLSFWLLLHYDNAGFVCVLHVVFYFLFFTIINVYMRNALAFYIINKSTRCTTTNIFSYSFYKKSPCAIIKSHFIYSVWFWSQFWAAEVIYFRIYPKPGVFSTSYRESWHLKNGLLNSQLKYIHQTRCTNLKWIASWMLFLKKLIFQARRADAHAQS